MAAGALFTLALLPVPAAALSHGGNDSLRSFPLSFWEYLYENEYYQPVSTLTASLEPDESDWIQKAALGAWSEWLLRNHDSATGLLRKIVEEADLDFEEKNSYQRKLEGWYLSGRQLDAFKKFRVSRNTSSDGQALHHGSDNKGDPLTLLNTSIYHVFSRNPDEARDAFYQLSGAAEEPFMERTETDNFYRELNALPSSKSPFLAGALSTFVPGSGMLYAGRTWDAAYSFLLAGGLAALTGESIVNNGLNHYSSIILGGLGFSFHIGNIYGSYRRVKEYNESLYYDLDNASDDILDKYYTP